MAEIMGKILGPGSPAIVEGGNFIEALKITIPTPIPIIPVTRSLVICAIYTPA
jgi:hypothetical protein